MKLQAPIPDLRQSRRLRRPGIRDLDRLAQVRDGLRKGRAPQRLLARLAPPFDRQFVKAGLSEVARNRLRFGRRTFGFVAQDFGGAAMQRLTATLEQALIGGILDQRVPEAVIGLRPDVVGDQDVSLGEPRQRRSQQRVRYICDGLNKRVRETAPEHGSDLGDLARRPSRSRRAASD